MRKQPRLTVEECLRLSIVDLRRAGLFRGNFGRWSSSRWSDADGKKIRAVVFRINDSIVGLTVEIREDVGISLPTLQNSPQQMIPIMTTRCHFGGVRRWFICPAVQNGVPCRRRATILYATSHERLFACRQCHNLTFESAQRHDSRLDALVKLPFEQFKQVFFSGNAAEQLLASRALPRIRKRLEKQLAKSLQMRGIRPLSGPNAESRPR